MAQRASSTKLSHLSISRCDQLFSIHSSCAGRGFTIVELLIVIVVIGILAAITLVAYNGVTDRANASAAQSAASQASKKVIVYATINSDVYPTTLADADILDTDSMHYQYRVDNSLSPRFFCITATARNLSYWVASDSPTPKSGACPGQGANGISPITNLVSNPSLTYNSTGWSTSGDIGATRTQVSGDWGWQGVRTGSGAAVLQCTSSCAATVTVGDTYTASAMLTSSVNQTVSLRLRRTGNTATLTQGPDVSLVAGVPQRVSFTSVAPETSVYIAVYSVSGTSGTTLRIDDIMLTEGDTLYTFADGDSPNWLWNGTQGGSTSTGQPL